MFATAVSSIEWTKKGSQDKQLTNSISGWGGMFEIKKSDQNHQTSQTIMA